MEDFEIWISSFASSPEIRRAPQSWFSLFIWRINSIWSCDIVGLPGEALLDGKIQNFLTRFLYHLRIVSGLNAKQRSSGLPSRMNNEERNIFWNTEVCNRFFPLWFLKTCNWLLRKAISAWKNNRCFFDKRQTKLRKMENSNRSNNELSWKIILRRTFWNCLFFFR